MKIHDGTPRGEEKSLCETCRHSRIVRGRTLDEEIVSCDLPMRAVLITFRVTSCTHYDDQRFPNPMELMQRAWILKTGPKGRPAGFVRASDLHDEGLESVTWRPDRPRKP